MRERNIGVNEIIGALQMSNLEFPGGRIETGTNELVVKTKGRIQTAENFGELVLASTPAGIIRLSDVASVKDTLEEKRTLAWLEGKDCIGLVVRKKSGANTVKVAENIAEKVKYMRETLPAGIKIEVPSDNSVFIRGSFETLLHHLMIGSLWATIIVFFFLRNVRTTLISAIAIPTSIIGTFIFMQIMGFTLNMVSMLGLSSCVGMLIDDAIVVLENIYRHIESGKHPKEAAKFATGEIGLAVMATTFSIVAVFIPVAYTYGMIGRFLYEFGMTVSFAVLISLFVSFTLTPMLCSKFLTLTKSKGIFFSTIEKFLNSLDHGYRRLIGSALRHKAMTVGIAFLVFLFSIWLGKMIPMEFQPGMDMEMFSITVTTPPGSPITEMEKAIVQVEKVLHTIPEIKTIFTTVGAGQTATTTEASVSVALLPLKERKKHQKEIEVEARNLLKDIPGAKISIGSAHGFGGKDLEVVLKGQDIDELLKYSDMMVANWKATPGFVEPDMSYETGKPEVRVNVDRERASSMGLSILDVASTINSLLSGETAVTVFKEGGRDYDVKAKLAESYRNEPSDLLTIPIRSRTGKLIDLGSVASIETGYGPTQINHRDGQKSITLMTNLDENTLKLGPAKTKTNEYLDQILPPDITYTYSGISSLMEESFRSLFFAMGLAVILIYMLLASQYENLIHPLAIMLSLPMSLVGALGALFIFHQTMSIMTMIGFIMMMGVVTKNAILLVDYTNTLRKRGMERDEALKAAGPVRLRPILMTSMATVFGLLPIAISKGIGSEMNGPVAVCIIGGLITSTMLTLVVVPVVYSLLDSWTERITNRFRRKETL
jgi:HAE1 family hydrophobic/amphiphilic exporter-1